MTPSAELAAPLSRTINRVKRQILTQFPPARWAADGRHEERRRHWAPYLPVLDAQQAALVSTLNRDAIRIGLLEDLAIPRTAELKNALDALVGRLAAQSADGASTLRPSLDELLDDMSLWHWGLEPRLLDVVENYLGVPARYYGADVRREVGNGQVEGVRQWHLDVEDRRTVKILVWLNDVDEQGGPFAYLPVAESLRAVGRLHYVSGFVADDRLDSFVPADAARTATGPTWTTIVADNCRLLHRATPPVARDRYSVTFTWSSRTPIKTQPAPDYSTAHLERIRTGLSARQLECLPPSMAG
ncbi:hypothetical protein [Georgenia sp. Z1491]|uniref:hypothetical protein n=1 Tax=Georgenia sp. Z1491 TaxID=3416707 RepID=UPI003CF6CF69